MPESLLPKRFLFRFSLPCLYRDPLWTAKGAGLDAKHRLVSFAELDDGRVFADVRAAWSEAGVALAVQVEGKGQAPWCRESRPEDSDGVQFWIDTRDVHNVHRASRFCHRFLFLPSGGGHRLDQPVGLWMPIHRAKEHPRAIRPESLRGVSQSEIPRTSKSDEAEKPRRRVSTSSRACASARMDSCSACRSAVRMLSTCCVVTSEVTEARITSTSNRYGE